MESREQGATFQREKKSRHMADCRPAFIHLRRERRSNERRLASTITARCDPSLLHSQGVYLFCVFALFVVHICAGAKVAQICLDCFFVLAVLQEKFHFFVAFFTSRLLFVCRQWLNTNELFYDFAFCLIVELLKSQHLCLILIFGA